MKTKEWLNEFGEDKAQSYDDFIDNFIPGYRLFQELLVTIISSQQQEKNLSKFKCLIIGAGTGSETKKIAHRFPECSLLAIEPSNAMFRKLVTNTNKFKNVETKNCFLHEVQEYDFDFIISSLVMHFIEDNGEKKDFLEKVFTSLKVGGSFLVMDKMKHAQDDFELLNYWQEFLTINRGSKQEALNSKKNIAKELNRIEQNRLTELATSVGFKKIVKIFQALHINGYCIKK